MRAETAASFETQIDLLLAAGRGFVVTEQSNIYHHETLREAAVRFHSLRDRGLAPALTRCRDGKLLEWDMVRAYCPHVALDATGRVMADSEDGHRDEGRTRLGHLVLTVTRPRKSDYPLGEPPTFRNCWTGEVLDFEKGVSLACRATPPVRGQG